VAALFVDSPVFYSHIPQQRHNQITAHPGPLPPLPLSWRVLQSVQGHQPKIKEPHIALFCTISWSYRRLEGRHSCGRRDLRTTHHLHTLCGPRGSWKVTRAMDKGSSTLLPCSMSNFAMSNLLINMQGKTGIPFMKKTSHEFHQHYLS